MPLTMTTSNQKKLPKRHHHLILFISFNFCLWLQPSITSAKHVPTNETDRLALLKFKQAIQSDPQSVLSSWNDSVNLCDWVGITCSLRHHRVTALDLADRNLRGLISPYIANLTFLRFISLSNNTFFGEIPPDIGRLFRLQDLNLYNNTFGGEIPVNSLINCSNLRCIQMMKNNLTGKLPKEIGLLVKLEIIAVAQNNLTGEIPPTIGNLSSLEYFEVSGNSLEGQVPDEIGRLRSLYHIGIGANSLSGTIPSTLYNISSITTISMGANYHLRGTLPANIGITLPNLQFLGLGGNEFSGSIPASLRNISKLQIFSISENHFMGTVPTYLGDLQELTWLDIARNNFGSNSSKDLDFIRSLKNCSKLTKLFFHRNLGGVLPKSIANLSSRLNYLVLDDNQLSGHINGAIFQNLIKLIALSMAGNHFTGIIPSSFGNLRNLQVMYLSGNKLSGDIPSSLGNLTKLTVLSLANNMLEGTIPPSVGSCQSLLTLDISENKLFGAIPQQVLSLPSLSQVLNLSKNSLNGTLPAEVGELRNLNAMDLSQNSLSGEIPQTIGGCQSIEYLYLDGNSIHGIIPSSLASLKAIQYLDLSRNKLSGPIPKDLEKIQTLLYLNLSYNNLEGELPSNGVFGNASGISLTGNAKLCGGVSTLRLPTCPIKGSNQGRKHYFQIIITVVGVAMIFVVLATFVVVNWRRKLIEKSTSALSINENLPQVSYWGLYKATDGFSPSNLIGSGGFGSVYKGLLDQGQSVAVKVLNLQQLGASRSFIAECNALRNIGHRNLVKILTCCSSTDYSHNEFKALIFEFMTNGSLEKWLHLNTGSENQSRNLSLIERLSVAIDVASALHYLHEQCETTILHCDIKPGNVLLENDMIAHLGDFGLARLLLRTDSSSQSSTVGIMGTIGYACPEYGMGSQASKQGDVYSYGILLLEMFTGKRPTDPIFLDGLNLHTFVKNALPGKLLHIVDPNILPLSEVTRETASIMATQEETLNNNNNNNNGEISPGNQGQVSGINHVQSCLLSVLKVGVRCSMESPEDRTDMKSVTGELVRSRKAFLHVNGGP